MKSGSRPSRSAAAPAIMAFFSAGMGLSRSRFADWRPIEPEPFDAMSGTDIPPAPTDSPLTLPLHIRQ
jgi:hypothetical protein